MRMNGARGIEYCCLWDKFNIHRFKRTNIGQENSKAAIAIFIIKIKGIATQINAIEISAK